MDKKRYTIEFRYTDNDQIYRDDVELTDREHARVKAFLEQLKAEGYIDDAGGGDDTIDLIYPFSEPRFLSYRTLRSHWKDSCCELRKIVGYKQGQELPEC